MLRHILHIIGIQLLIFYFLLCHEQVRTVQGDYLLQPKKNSRMTYLQRAHPFLRDQKLTKSMKSLLRSLNRKQFSSKLKYTENQNYQVRDTNSSRVFVKIPNLQSQNYLLISSEPLNVIPLHQNMQIKDTNSSSNLTDTSQAETAKLQGDASNISTVPDNFTQKGVVQVIPLPGTSFNTYMLIPNKSPQNSEHKLKAKESCSSSNDSNVSVPPERMHAIIEQVFFNRSSSEKSNVGGMVPGSSTVHDTTANAPSVNLTIKS